MAKKTVRDIEVKGKKVFVRVDYNVPLDEAGNITDTTRIKATLPTLKYLLENGAALILASHLGRPKGQPVKKYSLAPVAKRLGELLGREILFMADCVSNAAQAKAEGLKEGEILLLENLRFYQEEEKNSAGFAEKLAKLADIAVNDAFGVSHRAHASVEGITRFLPMAAGFLMEKEIEFLGKVVNAPARPFVAIVGGAKVSDKIGVIENLLSKVDTLIIGGGMANTFIAARGLQTGKSLVEQDKLDLAKALMAAAAEKQVKLLLPADVVIAEKFAADAKAKVVPIEAIDPEWMALDIGPASAQEFGAALIGAKTVVWNGPMGVFEMPAFAWGTEAVAQAVAACGAVTIVGGGDSVAAVEKMGVAEKISHISTGGGASLEFLEGKALPGIAALSDKQISRGVNMRKPIIAGNWKMYKTVAEAVALVKELETIVAGAPVEVLVCPPFTAIYAVKQQLVNSTIKIGAQDVFWEDEGAFTGQVAPKMLKAAGCDYVIIGHSERRQYFGETDEMVNKKLKAALEADLLPIVCVGETLQQREANITEKVIEAQLTGALSGLAAAEAARLVIAYEPVWAIGTGHTASAEDAAAVCGFIRQKLGGLFGDGCAAEVRIQYGGSVKPENIVELMEKSDIDGALVGGASLNPYTFGNIVRFDSR